MIFHAVFSGRPTLKNREHFQLRTFRAALPLKNRELFYENRELFYKNRELFYKNRELFGRFDSKK